MGAKKPLNVAAELPLRYKVVERFSFPDDDDDDDEDDDETVWPNTEFRLLRAG